MINKKSIAIAGGNKPDGQAAAKQSDATDKAVVAALVVFGRDDGGKAHASRFDEDNKEAAVMAAHLMGFVALTVTDDTVRKIAADLPNGRVFESGKGFVPFVKEGVCAALEAHAKQFPDQVVTLSEAQVAELANAKDAETKNGSGTPPGGADISTTTLPKDWSDIPVGSRVLAIDVPEDGWWEAKVTHSHLSGKGDKAVLMLTLIWLGWPEDPSFVRRASEVALLHPSYKPDTASEGGA